ncbi:hypothetical protein [Phaeobacter sp. HF9A]|uniref:hypothetical protein n=1 Tax=Phaeobacter sp. HF9A TaxID=2721561 RepID=UPI0014314C8B|nr:hypothetical protein [Phaeobacter sp. HF9A]NIZ14087.1 hypothetical protein [Phaeobacter sp. HF9A]
MIGLFALGGLALQFIGEEGAAPQTEVATAESGSFSEDLARLVAAPASAADGQNTAGQPIPSASAGLTASSEDMMAKMTAGTLAVLRGSGRTEGGAATATVAPAPTSDAAAGSELLRMVMTAHEQGQSDAYIDRLLNDAYSRQAITVPAGLIGADGRVDTATILSLFIQK